MAARAEGAEQRYQSEVKKFLLHKTIFKVYLCKNCEYVNTNM